MKKIAIIATCILASIGAVHAQKDSFGIKAGTNISGFLLYNMEGSATMKFGAEIGAFYKHDFSKHFAIQPEVLFTLHNSEYKWGYLKQDFMSWGMKIPVYALGQIHTTNGHRAYLGIGPYFYVGIGGKERNTHIGIFEKVNNNSLLNRFDLGGAVLIGYEFDFNMQINVGYKYGFFNALGSEVPVTPSLDNTNTSPRMANHSISLGIGYRF